MSTRPASAGYERLAIRPLDARERESLAALTSSLAQALQDRDAGDGLEAREIAGLSYDAYISALEGHRELSWIAVPTLDERLDIYLDGHAPEPLLLRDLLSPAASALRLPMLEEFFESRRVHSLTLGKYLTPELLRAVVQLLRDLDRTFSGCERARAAMRQRGVDNASVRSTSESMGAERGLGWRSVALLTRLALDGEGRRASEAWIDDVLHGLRATELWVDVVLNMDLVTEAMQACGVRDPVGAVVGRMPPVVRGAVLATLRTVQKRLQDDGHPGALERPDLADAVSECIAAMVGQLLADERPEGFDALLGLIARGDIHLEELPRSVYLRVQARRVALEVMQQPAVHIASYATDPDIVPVASHLPMLASELVRVGGLVTLVEIVGVLVQRVSDPATPAEIAMFLRRVLAAVSTPETMDAIAAAYPGLRRDDRLRTVELLGVFGPGSARALVGILRKEDARPLVEAVVEVLRQLCAGDKGPQQGRRMFETVLLAQVKAADATPQAIANALCALARCDLDVSSVPVASLLEHADPIVREAAIPVVPRRPTSDLEAKTAAMLNDPVLRVREVALETLGAMKSRHPLLLRLYRQAFDLRQEADVPETLRRLACVALGRDGNFEITQGVDAESLLCDALSGASHSVLGLKLGRRSPFSQVVRGLACDALARIGGARAIAALLSVASDADDPVCDRARLGAEALRTPPPLPAAPEDAPRELSGGPSPVDMA